MKVRLGESRQEKADCNSRRSRALPLTPQTQELSPVKDHRYRRRRSVGGEQRRQRTVTATVTTKTNCARGETTEGRKDNRMWRTTDKGSHLKNKDQLHCNMIRNHRGCKSAKAQSVSL